MKIRLSAGLLVLVVALAVAAAGFGRTTAIVKLGGLCDLSGPTSDVGVSYCKGELDYITYFNRKGGFSNKAKANISLPDFAYNVAKAQQLYAQITAGNPVAFMGWGTADTTALGPQITRDKLPFMSASLAEQLTNPKDTPYNFVAGTNYTAQAQIAAKYIDRTTSGQQGDRVLPQQQRLRHCSDRRVACLHRREELRLHRHDVPDDHRNAPPSMRSSCRRSRGGPTTSSSRMFRRRLRSSRRT